MKRGDLFYTQSAHYPPRFLMWVCCSHHPDFGAISAKRAGSFREPLLMSDQGILCPERVNQIKEARQRSNLLARYQDVLAVWSECNGDWRKIALKLDIYHLAAYQKCQTVKRHGLVPQPKPTNTITMEGK